MSDDKIEAIRARHNDDTWRYYELPSQMHDDRAFLLAEVDRLSSDLRVQQGCCDGAAAQDAHIRREREEHKAEVEKLRVEIERLRNEDTKTRHALGGWVWVCPDGGDEPTHERVAAVVAEVERLRAEIERLRAENAELQRSFDDGYQMLEVTQQANDKLRADNELLREVLEGIRIDGPDAHGLVWATIQHPSITARSHAMTGSMDRMVSQVVLEFEQIRRKALEGKP